MEILHKTNQILANRYRIIDHLGEGGSAITYQAQDLETGDKVALKVLSLRHLDNWQKVELFEKEAKILQQLDHPNIPKYLDYFQDSETEEQNFYIVEQLAPGKSLATLIEEGWQPDEKTVKAIATQLLEIIIYLQGLIPPVIHRDIKPQNIIYNNSEIFLVDFGTVQETYRNTITASIAVGTPDYMAPEQMSGKANLSTDLYGLGMTLLFLLTGNSPMFLPQHKLKIDFRKQVKISKDFAVWLDKLIEPKSDNRFPNAQSALNVLQNPKTIKNYISLRQKCASYTSISLNKTEDKLLINIPPALLRNHYNRFLVFGVVSWYVILFFITLGVFVSTNDFFGLLYVGIILLVRLNPDGRMRSSFYIAFLSLLFLSFLLIYFGKLNLTIFISALILLTCLGWQQKIDRLLLETIFATRLEITKQEFCVRRKFFNKWIVNIKQNMEAITKINVKDFLFFSSALSLTVDKSTQKKKQKPFDYEIGGMLTQAEKLWLKEEIDNFLR